MKTNKYRVFSNIAYKIYCLKGLKFSLTAGVAMEEGKLNSAIFSAKETNPPLLLLHLILHNPSFNHVCP